MKAASIKVTGLVTAMSIATLGCENLTPGENAALAGTAAGLATGIPLLAAGVDPAIAAPVTVGAIALAAGGTYLIAKQQASIRQRKIAEQRARLYYANLEKQQAQQRQNQASASRKKASRYIAVDTVREGSSQGEKTVMIFDTQTNQIVGNNTYDLKTTPKVGTTTKLDTYTAEYVGTGA